MTYDILKNPPLPQPRHSSQRKRHNQNHNRSPSTQDHDRPPLAQPKILGVVRIFIAVINILLYLPMSPHLTDSAVSVRLPMAGVLLLPPQLQASRRILHNRMDRVLLAALGQVGVDITIRLKQLLHLAQPLDQDSKLFHNRIMDRIVSTRKGGLLGVVQ